MKQIIFRWMMLASSVFALVALPASRAVADDEGDETEIKVEARLDAVDCAATPPTITMLGLTIDISQAKIEGDEDDDGLPPAALACADLTVGQFAEVKLASDIPNATTGLLSALEVDVEGDECADEDEEECNGAEVEAPLQAVDPGGNTVTVLGLVIDISQASLEGADDGDDEESNQPVDPSQLIVGQFVEIKLASSEPPLVATDLEVKNFANEVEVEVVDENGNEVDDGDDDVHIDVEVAVPVKAPAALSAAKKAKGKGKGTNNVVRFHLVTNGSAVLNGLPTGTAKITVNRLHNGRRSAAKSSSFTVQANGTTHVLVRLKPAKR